MLAKRAEFDDDKCTREELRKVEDEAITAAVKQLQDLGIHAVTDGEFRRHMCASSDLFRRVERLTRPPIDTGSSVRRFLFP